eukprot:4186510-Pleurochrysis_carterae.AAC.2
MPGSRLRSPDYCRTSSTLRACCTDAAAPKQSVAEPQVSAEPQAAEPAGNNSDDGLTPKRSPFKPAAEHQQRSQCQRVDTGDTTASGQLQPQPPQPQPRPQRRSIAAFLMQAAVQQQTRSLHATEAIAAAMSRAAAEAADFAASLNSSGDAEASSSSGFPSFTPAEATPTAATAATALALFKKAQRSSLENPAEEPPHV